MNDDRLREMLHRDAERIRVPQEMPSNVRRRIRTRHALAVGGLSLLLTLAGVGAWASWMEAPRTLPPVGGNETPRGESVIPLASGTEGTNHWEMVWRQHPNAEEHREDESVCITVEGSEPSCLGLTPVDAMAVGFEYLRRLDRILVVIKVPAEVPGVMVREVEGTSWAGLVAKEGDPAAGSPGFFYRFFEEREVSIIASMEHPDTPYVALSLEVDRGPNRMNTSSSFGRVGTDVPELRNLEGTKRIVASGGEGGGYTVIARETEEELCLHLAETERCRSLAGDDDPIRLLLAVVRPCLTEDLCGPPGRMTRRSELTIVAGEVAPEVDRVGLRDAAGVTFVQTSEGMRGSQEPPPGTRNVFSTVINQRFAGEVVAFDGDRELGSVRVTPIEQPDPRAAELERRVGFLRSHLADVRSKIDDDPELEPQRKRSARRLLRELRREEAELRRLLERQRS